MRYVVIMAGGSGKRLWPLSRQGQPKQLLSLVEGRSLLRMAYERVAGMVPDANILICTGARYAEEVAAQLPELPVGNLLGEPEGRDSLNAVAWPAAVLALRDPDAVVAVLTADQMIEPVEAFRASLEDAYAVAEADPSALVTFGVVPTSPHTGYGYLHRGDALESGRGFRVLEFREKPEREVAEGYLASGDYWWNAGMFVWRASTLLEQVRLLLPDTHASVLELAAHPELLGEIYPTLMKTSVDYGVMEPVSKGRGSGHVVAVPLAIRWYDIGGFASLAELMPADDQGNAREGTTVVLDARDNLVLNHGREGTVVALVGVHGLVVVTTPTATLVVPLDQAERVKDLVGVVAEEAGPELA